jgi:hypothetical protein
MTQAQMMVAVIAAMGDRRRRLSPHRPRRRCDRSLAPRLVVGGGSA